MQQASIQYPAAHRPTPTEPTTTVTRLRTVTGNRFPRKCSCGCGCEVPRDPEVRYVVDVCGLDSGVGPDAADGETASVDSRRCLSRMTVPARSAAIATMDRYHPMDGPQELETVPLTSLYPVLEPQNELQDPPQLT